MKTITVQVQDDHLEVLSRTKPMSAMAELIWNALDAEATELRVEFDENELQGIERIRIIDNGHGLHYDDAFIVFQNLGGSWKRAGFRTHMRKRALHGKYGKGRFRAFSLGNDVSWHSVYQEAGDCFEYAISGRAETLGEFQISNCKGCPEGAATGMVVDIACVPETAELLRGVKALSEVTDIFALYLRQYSGVRIIYDGQPLDPSVVEDHVADYLIGPVWLKNGNEAEAELTIVEWSVPTERALFLCDENGFCMHKVPPGIQAPGFIFTGYLKSGLIRELGESGDLLLEELQPDLKELLEAGKEKMRNHFRQRSAEKAGGLVEQWKREEVYPYLGTPTGPIEEIERQVFDVIALNVHEFLPDFDGSSTQNRRFSFRLLRTALETSPDAIHTILHDVLNLPAAKQQELAELLERTSLEAIINASKVVADRLDFLQGLELLVFDAEVKRRTLERRHLHKVVAEHTWLFGEHFHLTNSDKSLTNVLRRHLDLARIDLLDETPVVREDGTEGIIDLMLSRVVPQSRADCNEHLIVELKRPTVKIGNSEASQIKDYATAVVRDERFSGTNTRWEFWAVANDVTESVQLEASQSGRPRGLLWHHEDLGLRIWVKTWGQVIEDCRARLRFFQERLNYVADEDSGLEYLRRVHAKYLPKGLAEESPEKPSGSAEADDVADPVKPEE